MTPTLISVLKSMQPGGDYAVLGALALVALVVCYWYGVKGLGKVIKAVDQRNLSGIYVLPLLAVFVYTTWTLVTAMPTQQDPNLISGVLLVLAFFQAFAILHLAEVYSPVVAPIWAVLRLGFRSSVMVSFWSTAYLGMLAFLVPSTVGAMAVILHAGVFFSITVYHAASAWLNGVNGGRRMAVFAGHLLLALACAALAHVYSYSSNGLDVMAEVYCTGMTALSASLLYLDRFEERVPLLPGVNTPFGPATCVVAGVVLAGLGFTPSAWILIPVGLLGLVIEYNHRPSRSA